MTKYYKVVNSQMKSAIIGRNSKCGSELEVQYKLQEWVYPKFKGSNLMCFNDLEKARKFQYDHCEYGSIFECKVKNPRKNGFVDTFWSNVTLVFWNKILDRKKKHKQVRDLYYNRDGWIFCNAIKLIRRV